MNFHVARALKFFKDHLIHPAARIDQGCGDNREAASLLYVSGGSKKTLRFVKGV